MCSWHMNNISTKDSLNFLLGRPKGGLLFYRRCIFYLFRHSFSQLPRPIALKLCHMVGIWPYFIIPLQKFGGPKKIWGPKTCKISVNFGPLQTLIANISGTAQDIQNWKANVSRRIPPAFNEKDPVNFGPLITALDVSLDPLKCTYLAYYISTLRGCCALKFLHALEIDSRGENAEPAHLMLTNLIFKHPPIFNQYFFGFLH